MLRLLSNCVACITSSMGPNAPRMLATNLCTQPQLTEYKNILTYNPDREGEIRNVLELLNEWKQKSRKVPSRIAEEDMEYLLNMEYWDRVRYFKKLWQLEWTVCREIKKEERQSVITSRKGFNSSLFDVELVRESLERHYAQKLCTASMYGQPLILDLGYSDEMQSAEVTVAATNLHRMYDINRMHCDPFDLHVCGIRHYEKPASKILQLLMCEVFNSMDVTHFEDKSFVEIFPRDRLVYLSPDAEETLYEYDHNAIYIIGVLVELSDRKPSSFWKAQQEGIRTARLPLKEYGRQCKLDCLKMIQVMRILSNVKVTGNWELAISSALCEEDFE